ncbi:MAG: glycosyltransferase [Planctomycetota bacterium]|nr:glycosyltransferase [Planctomycetota bacterium]
MLVSIVIPCYRQGHFLRTAIDSALAQTYAQVEVVVVNDGSDDDTDAVARSYGSGITYISQQNRGLPLARNAGTEVAKGDYLLFLDADDAIHSQAIEWMTSAIVKPGSSIIVGAYATFVDSPDVLLPCEMPAVQQYQDELVGLIQGNFGPPHCYLVPTALVRSIGGFEKSMPPCADWDCWVRLVVAGGRVTAIPQVTAFYRDVIGSMSKNLDQMLISRSQVLIRLHDSLREKSLLKQYGTILMETESRVIRRYYARGLRHETLQQLKQMTKELSDLGFKPPETAKQRIARVLFGWNSEALLVAWYRLTDRSHFAFLSNGYT